MAYAFDVSMWSLARFITTQGNFLKAIRSNRSQFDAAKYMGVDLKTYQKYEKDELKAPDDRIESFEEYLTDRDSKDLYSIMNIITTLSTLNDTGLSHAAQYIDDLAKIPSYTIIPRDDDK